MKRAKILWIGAFTTLVTSVGVTAALLNTHQNSSKPKSDAKESKIVKPETTQNTHVEEPAATQTVNDTQDTQETPQTSSQAVTEQSTAPTVASIDELKAEYGWNSLAGDPLSQVINREPQYFTEQYRVQAFKYMHDAGLAAAQKNGSTSSNSINFYWMQAYRQNGSFVATGTTLGIDWNNYING